MASVHPSRMAMVPGARRSPPRRSPTPPPPPPLSREEELKLRLLAKRKQHSHTPDSATGGGLKIKGLSKHVEVDEEEPLADIYQDEPVTRRESPEPGPSRRNERSKRSPSMNRPSDMEGPRREERRSRSRSRPRYDDRYPPRQRSRSRDRDRRPSPSYRAEPPRNESNRDYGYSSQRDDLRRPPPPHLPPFPPKWDQRGAPPPPSGGNGFMAPPMRIGFGGPPPGNGVSGPGPGQGQGSGHGPRPYGGSGFRNGGAVDFDKRRLERENNPLSIWPQSPKSPYRDEDDPSYIKSKKKSKRSKSKRHRRYSDESDSTDSEEEDRRRRRRREKRKKESERYSDDELERGEKKERRRRRTSEARSDSEDERRRRSSKSKSKSRSAVSPTPWIEKEKSGVASQSAMAEIESDSDNDGDMVGPSLPSEHKDKARRQAFKDMLPGEAAAMAAFAADGKRIPRRGEIGIDSSRIEEFEASGFVMSGNRHKKMNAVRMKKENQIISAEEKRAILNLQKEERMKKEGAIISQFKELLDENWRSQGLKDKPHD